MTETLAAARRRLNDLHDGLSELDAALARAEAAAAAGDPDRTPLQAAKVLLAVDRLAGWAEALAGRVGLWLPAESPGGMFPIYDARGRRVRLPGGRGLSR
jgi:hypothetical protein